MKFSKNLVYKSLIVVFLIFFAFLLLSLLIFPSGKSSSKSVEVEIVPGMSLVEIAKLLSEKNIIRNPYLLVITAKVKGKGERILPGKYKLYENMSYTEALEVLEKGPLKRIFKVTIPEGFTIEEIAERLKKTHLSSDKFRRLAQEESFKFKKPFLKNNPTQSLEGYLFPKTYTFTEDIDEVDFINLLLNQFEKETARLDFSKAYAKGFSLHQIITIASLIEEEVKVPEERELVSAVIYNRLQRRMPLRIDATIQYILPQRKPKLLETDLRINSPYNTYLHPGLPPGPICNPSLESIKAALNPAPVSYLYYVLTDPETGKHTFTTTYKEFLEAKRRAR